MGMEASNLSTQASESNGKGTIAQLQQEVARLREELETVSLVLSESLRASSCNLIGCKPCSALSSPARIAYSKRSVLWTSV